MLFIVTLGSSLLYGSSLMLKDMAPVCIVTLGSSLFYLIGHVMLYIFSEVAQTTLCQPRSLLLGCERITRRQSTKLCHAAGTEAVTDSAASIAPSRDKRRQNLPRRAAGTEAVADSAASIARHHLPRRAVGTEAITTPHPVQQSQHSQQHHPELPPPAPQY